MNTYVNLIKEALKKKNINKYKIIYNTTKSFWYKEAFEKISYDSSEINKSIVIFKMDNKIFRFDISPTKNNFIIDHLIETSLKNPFDVSSFWFEENSIIKESYNEEKKFFKNFNNDKILNKLKNNFDFIKKETNLKLNISYKINISKQNLLTYNQNFRQFYINSDFLCVDNKFFKKFISLKNLYLNENFLKKIIYEINKKEIYSFESSSILNNLIIIKKGAVADFINEYILAFYANNIYYGKSFVDKKNIKNILYKKDFDITALPFKDIFFDLDGNFIKEKKIISHGKFVNLLSNQIYSKYLNINNFGNADLENPDMIAHQRLKFILNEKFNLNPQLLNTALTIHKIENLTCDIKNQTFSGIAVYDDNNGKFYKTFLNMNFSDFFNNIFSTKNSPEWINNVYCNDIIYYKTK